MNQESSLLHIQQKHKQANRNELNGDALTTGMLLLMLNPPLLHFHPAATAALLFLRPTDPVSI